MCFHRTPYLVNMRTMSFRSTKNSLSLGNSNSVAGLFALYVCILFATTTGTNYIYSTNVGIGSLHFSVKDANSS